MRKLLLVCLVAACGGDDDSGGPISAAEFNQRFEEAICNFYVNCGLLENRAQCAQIELDAHGATEAMLAGVEMGTVTFDPDAAATCLTRFSTCERYSVFGLTSAAAAACSNVFHGTVAAGGACTDRSQCASNSCSLACDPGTCCEGTCVGDTPTLVYVKLGETCGNGKVCTDSQCDRTTSTCAALKPVGSVCNEGFECETQHCDNDVCADTVATGGACSNEDDCVLFGDECDGTTKTCTPVGLTGDACVDSGDCSPAYTCGTAKTCELGPFLGQPCESNCVDRTYCDSATTTCVARKPDGATCVENNECDGGTCTTQGTCVTKPLCI